MRLHPLIRDRLDDIAGIELHTHRACMRVLDKTGPLYNPADRDHCLQYMVATGLLKGDLTASDYEEAAAADPRIDRLRALMTVSEEKRFSKDYLDPDKRSNANTVGVRFKSGSGTEEATVEYPVGHPRRRSEGIPLLLQKFKTNLARRYPVKQQAALLELCLDRNRLERMPVHQFVDMLAI